MEKAIKSLGQNFLKDISIVRNMVLDLGIVVGDSIVEIGPGPGVFTREIVKAIEPFSSINFTAVELDPRFAKQLKLEFQNKNNIKIIEYNFLEWIKLQTFDENTVVLGSIPYYITSPIIHSLIKSTIRPKTIILMIQKEVAEKICEKNAKPNYFSNFVKTFYDVSYVTTVPREKFSPVPKVDSAVIKMVRKDLDFSLDVIAYEDFLHKGFKHQKKMLNKVFKLEHLSELGITGTDRPHNLKLEDWLKIFMYLNSKSTKIKSL